MAAFNHSPDRVGSATERVTALLSVQDLSVVFGGIVALDGVSFDVQWGQITGLIGPNGAGKSTLFNCLSRLYEPSKGDIQVGGQSILGLRSHEIARIGIGRTFQNIALFPNLSVLENIRVGAHTRTRSDMISNALRLPWVRREENLLTERIWEIAEYLELATVGDREVGSLPLGTQKRVELGRALASEPKILLLDEPAGGLNHEEVHSLGNLIRDIRTRQGLTILLVEHHMGLVMSVADRVVALDFGRKLADGSPAAVRSDPAVIAAYLGTTAT
jgi:branched-chain amino acid transport system ATP-binding protein